MIFGIEEIEDWSNISPLKMIPQSDGKLTEGIYDRAVQLLHFGH